MSKSALSAIIQENAIEPLPAKATRHDIREARDQVAEIATPHGTLHTTVVAPLSGTDMTMEVEIADPLPCLYWAAKNSRDFAKLLQQTCEKTWVPTAAKPWDLVLYPDEVEPDSKRNELNN